MAEKRKHESSAGAADVASDRSSKKQKKGFRVGPTNLPPGSQKRKVEKIKRSLIDKAKLKQEYARVKQRFLETQANEEMGEGSTREQNGQEAAAIHPSRVAMLEKAQAEQKTRTAAESEASPRPGRFKPQRYLKERAIAAQTMQEAEARKEAWAKAEQQRAAKQAERDRHSKALAKARGNGVHGQRKLGRESGVLLDKVKRLMAASD